jgi:hypothetical protein
LAKEDFDSVTCFFHEFADAYIKKHVTVNDVLLFTLLISFFSGSWIISLSYIHGYFFTKLHLYGMIFEARIMVPYAA